MQLYRAVVALAAWAGVVLQYYLRLSLPGGPGFVGNTLIYFSYFTVLSNLLVALAETVPLLAPRGRTAAFFLRPAVRSAILLYILVTGVVNFLLLRHLWSPQGLAFVGDTLLHYVVPVLFLIDWSAFVLKGSLRWRDPAWWMIFPICYAIYAMTSGALTGFYPYFFLDAGKLGYGSALLNIAAMAAAFIALSFLLVAIDRLLAKRRPA